MPTEVKTYLCCVCGKSFTDREKCEQHESNHESTNNVQLHYELEKIYPSSVTLHFQKVSIKYYAPVEGMKHYNNNLSLKIKS